MSDCANTSKQSSPAVSGGYEDMLTLKGGIGQSLKGNSKVRRGNMLYLVSTDVWTDGRHGAHRCWSNTNTATAQLRCGSLLGVLLQS